MFEIKDKAYGILTNQVALVYTEKVGKLKKNRRVKYSAKKVYRYIVQDRLLNIICQLICYARISILCLH